MKKINKKVAVSLAIILFLGTGQAYAASLNTNIIGLIRSSFISIKEYYIGKTNEQLGTINENEYKNDIKKFVDDKSTEVISDLETYKNGEVNRAKNEIDVYASELKQEVGTIANEEGQKIKTEIKAKADEKIRNVKTELDKELEKQIKDKLKIKK